MKIKNKSIEKDLNNAKFDVNDNGKNLIAYLIKNCTQITFHSIIVAQIMANNNFFYLIIELIYYIYIFVVL